MGVCAGMADALTNWVVDRTAADGPFVLKYVPYGALKEVRSVVSLSFIFLWADGGRKVMPYLGRRAIENKSMLTRGSAAEERRQAGREIRARLFSGWW
jgi:proline dehydrogenase